MADSFESESPRSGQGARVRLAALGRSGRVRGAALGMLAALPALALFSGFTVDDALVSARVASHLAAGEGYRFNLGGPEVDAVTPLGWAHLLAVWGRGAPLVMLERGRVLGVVGWLSAAAVLGMLLRDRSRSGRATALVVLATCAPAAAWASSGMETGLVAGFATLALVPGWVGALAAGVAAALRPELTPWAAVLAAGGVFLAEDAPRRRALRLLAVLGLCLGPVLAVALVRLAWFGSAAPLALSAKPPDLWPGVRYALAALLLSGPPLLLVAPLAIVRGRPEVRRLVAAVAAHGVALGLAGGDWMPLYRLAVPVLPTALLAGALLAETSSTRAQGIRVGLALAVSTLVAAVVGWPARHVLESRLEFIAAARPALVGSRLVAAVDAGLIGAATDHAVLDLAGVTDPSIARLTGGHTSKRIPDGLIESRGVDHAVLELLPGTTLGSPWQSSLFARRVEQRLAELPALEGFELVRELPLGHTAYRYLVVARPPPRARH